VKVGGIVLCGGRSSRMGRSKAWLPFGGERMLPRVVRLLSQAVDPVVVVAAPGQDVPPLPDAVAVVRDKLEGRGPLQGLAAGLEALRGRADAAFLSSCDAPLLRPAFVRRLIELMGRAVACAPRVGDRPHPLAAVYRLEAAGAVARLLAEGRLRAADLLDAVPTRLVSAAELADVDPGFLTLRNLNTPEEHEAALRLTDPRP
jgi:molybdenum cofactor guanylyltransferase